MMRLTYIGQMDWGSWLKICNRETMKELLAESTGKIRKIIPILEAMKESGPRPAEDLKNLPDGDWYGIPDAE